MDTIDDNNSNQLRTTLLENMIVATWNIRGINQKMPEIISELKKRKTDITVVSETKKKAKGMEEIDDYIFIYCGVEKEKSSGWCRHYSQGKN
jgi:exonuclease III